MIRLKLILTFVANKFLASSFSSGLPNAIYKMTDTEYERLMSFIPIFLFFLERPPPLGAGGKPHVDHDLQGKYVSLLVINFYRVYL